MPIINQVVKNTSSGTTKYGISIDSILGEVVNGTLNAPTTGPTDVVITGFSKVATNVMSYKFYNNRQILSLSAPDIVELSDYMACMRMLESCTHLTTLTLNGLTKIGSGISTSTGPCYRMCFNCSALVTVGLNSLAIIESYGMTECFGDCYLLRTVSLPALTQLGANALSAAFQGSGITELTLGGTSAITLATNSFGTGALGSSYMFASCTQNITVNAPAANQAEIEAMTGYPNFGCTGTVTWNWVS